MPRGKVSVTLPNGVIVLAKEDFIWRAYGYRCVLHPEHFATTLHEEPPKSQNPYWELQPDQRFTLCAEGHDLVHSIPRREASYMLYIARQRNFPDAVTQIDNYVEQNAKKS